MAYATDLPIHESLDHFLANSVEHLVYFTTVGRKGSHLAMKVKVICELLLTTIFDGKHCSYLLHASPVKRKNPYCSAMQIARAVASSGSILHLSDYNALGKGVKGGEDGKISR
jgi:hypothetical protein